MAGPNLEKLKQLSSQKQLVFAYLICERLYPNYVYFSENYDFGNPNSLRQSIQFIHENLFCQVPVSQEVDKFLQLVDKNTPDTETFETSYVSSALDACTAVTETLHFMVKKSFTLVEDIS